MKRIHELFWLVVLLSPLMASSQPGQTIRFKKQSNSLYFFPVQVLQGDTLVDKKSDLFFMHTSDSVKEFLIVQVENGRLVGTGNDSLLRLELVHGIRYESGFVFSRNEQKWKWTTRINGAAATPGNRIGIRMYNEHTGSLLLNCFYFRKNDD